MNRVLEFKNVEKYYGNKKNVVKAIDNLDLIVEQGEFIAIMGASGSGKTTLLNLAALIDKPTAGKISIESQEIDTFTTKQIDKFRAETLGFVFQDFNLIDSLNVYDNIALSMTLIGKKDFKKAIEEVTTYLGIGDFLNSYPYELSGGQKQRVAIARALVKEPALLLCDEPTGALDSKNAQQLLLTLLEVNGKGNTILMVTHDSYAASFAKRVIFINDGKLFTSLNRSQDISQQDFRQLIINTEALLRGE